MSEGNTYAVVDFEANGLPKPDVEREACLYFLKSYTSRNIFGDYANKLNAIFLELDHSFSKVDWGTPENTEQFESNFSLIWSNRKGDMEWKRAFIEKALKFCDNEFQWKFLTLQKDYLCYKADMKDILQNKGLKGNCISFDVKNEEHREIVLNAYFGPTILSCALLHMKKNEGKLEIIRHADDPFFYNKSRSKTDSCYYQAYKPDEHYIHSNEAERTHKLSQEWLFENGVKITDMIKQFLSLMEKYGNVKFVAHNFKADQQYLLHAIEKCISFFEYRCEIKKGNEKENDQRLKDIQTVQRLKDLQKYVTQDKNWICTLTEARAQYKDTTIFNLSSLYKKITGTRMPSTHNAQMDVYACATIFCDIRGVGDTSSLKELIGKIRSSEIVCEKPKDFWRYAVKSRDGKPKDPIADNFIDLNKWLICLKFDGFYVRLKRDGNKWRMYTRSGNELRPPTSFLEHLSLEFPAGMEIEGELVYDSNQRCELEHRDDVERRIEKRTLDFKKLHFSSLRSTKNFRAWHGLRLVLFAFPQMDKKFFENFRVGKEEINKTQDKHPHITACKYRGLRSTQQAIDIFKCVVQMGCEGVIVRNPDTVYNTTSVEDKYKSGIFKLKQKIVTEEKQKFKLFGEPKMNKDGREKEEVEYEVPEYKKKAGDAPRKIKFSDWRRATADREGWIEKRLKYHEKAKWKMGVWDLNERGMRHTCFATDADVSVEVEAKKDLDVALVAIVDSISVKTEPFQFIVETAYVFLDLVEIGKDKMDIGMLRLVGKTDQKIQPQWFLHKEYKRDNRGPIDQQFVADMTQFLHHIPNDNKRLVFVVTDKLVLEKFRTYTLDIIVKGRLNQGYNSLPKETIRRLEVNDKARKQQVDVILMEEWKAKKLFKTLIPWNSDCSAGLITEHISNENTVCALVSPQLSDEKFKEMCGKQFDNRVCLQNLNNKDLKKTTWNEIVLADIAVLPHVSTYTREMTLASYYDKVTELKLKNEFKHHGKALYNTLLEYENGKDNRTGIITKDDFEKAFEAARRREKRCPNDPFEPLTHKFPYMRRMGGDEQAHKNVWHRAWRMSEAFFRSNKMVVSGNAPDVFKRDPGLDLWIPVKQAVVRESSSDVEIIEETRPQNPEPRVDKVVKPRRERHPTIKRVLGGSESEDESKESPKHKSNERESERPASPVAKSPKTQDERDSKRLRPLPTKSPKSPESDEGLDKALVITKISPQPRPRPEQQKSNEERHSKKGRVQDQHPKSVPPPRPSAEEWSTTRSEPNADSHHKDSPHAEPSEYAKKWLEEEMLKKRNEKLVKIKALLQKLKMYAS
jgi:hypothetical protein